MWKRRHFAWTLAWLLFALPLRADLQKALAEPNLEKRSQLALENAAAVYKNARAAYDRGDLDAVTAAAKEIEESVDLAYTSLTKTGKDPRRSPKWFKKAEIQTRDLLRRLDSFQQEMSFADRPVLDAAKAKVTQVHDDLLVGLMEGKHR
jgi:hypothetical protein